MAVYLKQFSTHAEYDAYINGSGAILPNVSICTTEGDVHYNPRECEETTIYELVGEPSYPSTVEGDAESFDMSFDYKRTDIDKKCDETITEGSDTVTIEIGTNPSTSSSRTVEGVYDYHGLEIPYSVTQTKFGVKVTAKFNVTSTSNPTRIASETTTTSFSAIEIDGVKQSSVTTGYTFDTLGEHTVKYTLKDPTKIGIYTFASCYSLTSIDIPSGVTSIGSSAFTSCSMLTSIDIPDSVTSIGECAFEYCTSLTTCTIGSGVTSIGSSAFTSCSGLTNITVDNSNTVYDSRNSCNAIIETNTNILLFGCQNTIIPNGVTSIGECAFRNCRSLTSIDIPNSVISIGSDAFRGCSGLTSIDIPNSVTSIGQAAFRECSGLTSIDIPNSVTSIGKAAFRECRSLTSIYIPNSVTSIVGWSFQDCSSLTSCTIGSSVTTIGNYAFGFCYNLKSIISNATTAPTIQSSTFENVNTRGTLRVPSGSSGYDVWMGTGDYYLGKYNWTKVEQ